MRADDPRHGTVAGYNRIPCREECCRLAMANYKKRWQWDAHNGRARRVSTIGTRRRLESLAWLGWSRSEVAKRAGMHPTNMTRLLTAETMTVALAERLAKVYDELHQTLPTGNQQAITNVRNQARARGAVSPMMWLDIDDPDEQPDPGYQDTERPHDDLDPVVVERILAGDYRLTATPAERTDVCRQWVARGRSLAELERLTGWKPERYYKRSEVAA